MLITCEQCGKYTESDKIGNHWICADCRQERFKEDEKEDGRSRAQDD
jgi:DNA-directed RNA polymerase subunit RPC12/RpoP